MNKDEYILIKKHIPSHLVLVDRKKLEEYGKVLTAKLSHMPHPTYREYMEHPEQLVNLVIEHFERAINYTDTFIEFTEADNHQRGE